MPCWLPACSKRKATAAGANKAANCRSAQEPLVFAVNDPERIGRQKQPSDKGRSVSVRAFRFVFELPGAAP